ncbi:MAG: 30S ribosomal protein S5 [Candidatus Buchananbacteria bacterium RBG_13_39_9]|uniref:Small ribosomal subunit protein uS5 n=1 Tax=Candidatus Buchananbacteria bacterium RBG_13_39_9 TaxID=1797531 RepID=A0A1G1XPY9_9BACT|nr:MAG: 30S ribosomal protein S5 [Candidatus Buchananbacteria bacterium RBG_13_39_9]
MVKREKFMKKDEEFEQRIVDLARVTRVVAGGKRMRFRVTLAIGDKKGRVGIGIAKGADVTLAVNKAYNQAKKHVIKVYMHNETIPHQVQVKYKASQILLKPAPKGTGIKVGGAVRVICELAGIANIRGKILGSNNKISNLRATIIAMQSFKKDAKLKDKESTSEIKAAIPSVPKEDKPINKKSFKEKIKILISNK